MVVHDPPALPRSPFEWAPASADGSRSIFTEYYRVFAVNEEACGQLLCFDRNLDLVVVHLNQTGAEEDLVTRLSKGFDLFLKDGFLLLGCELLETVDVRTQGI